MRRARVAIFLVVLAVHGLAGFYMAMRREGPAHGVADDGFSTRIFFFANALQRDAARAVRARAVRSAQPRAAHAARQLLPVPSAGVSVAPQAQAPNVIDWAKEAQFAAADSLEAAARTRRRATGPSSGAVVHVGGVEPGVAREQFHWDYAATHRFEALPMGGTLINLTDRCSLLFTFPLLIGTCKLGQSEGRADLFAQMREKP